MKNITKLTVSIFFLTLFVYFASPSFAATSLTHQTTRFNSSISKSDFSITDNPQINIQEIPKKVSGVFKFIPKFIYSPPAPPSLKSTLKVVVKNSDNKTVDKLIPKIEEINGKIIVSLDKSQLKPGRYRFEISAENDDTIVQDFTWGVLSLNPDQTPYSVGDTAFLAMAVLDDHGDMVCNSDLTLTITKPDNNIDTLSTQNGQITKNDVCHTKDVTLIPDYQALYPITQTGNYHYTLTASNQNGTYSISDSFIAQNDPNFVIKRLAVTRIYPPNIYPVTLKITANQDFTGTITESVPSSFKITNTTAKITTLADRQLLTWNVSLSKGQTTSLKYSYLAPLISPERYLLGPLIFSRKNITIFTEPRSWQIASDDVTTYTANDNFVVPVGVSSIIVEAWGGGGGGGGGGGTNRYGGGGGAGGQYAKKTMTVSIGTTYSVTVGSGGTGGTSNNGNVGQDTIFGSNNVVAKGGAFGKRFVGTTGPGGIGSTASGIGDTIYAGGSGAGGITTRSGGGGGGAGSTGNGNDGSATSGGAEKTVNGGVGGSGTTATSGIGTSGQIYSAGGGGATKTSKAGNGAQGYLTITYTVNIAPTIPTLISPANSAVGQSTTLNFQTVTTDAYGDNVQYELKICTDSGMSANCQTFDQTASNVGWSGQNIGTSAYSSGTTATYILQVGNSLAENTTYYWKTRAKDYAGSVTWSETQTTPYSFFTNGPTILNQASFRWSADDVSGEARSDWYDSNYDYRIPITVTNNVGTTLTDFQVSISIGTSQLIAQGKMQSDCDDIRITDINGNLLPHWIEENNPGCNKLTNTKIWLKANSLPNSDSTVYLYYGNSVASNNENGNNVFNFFDNFNSGSLDTNIWTAAGTGGYSLSNNELTITTGSIYSKAPILQDSQNYIYEYRNKWSNTAGVYSGLHIADASYVGGSNYYTNKLVLFMCSSADLSIYGFAADGTVASYNISGGGTQYTATGNIYNINGFSIDSTNIKFFNNYSQLNSYFGTWSAPPYLLLGYYTGSNAWTEDLRDLTIDWVRARKYTATEPTFSLGTETTEPPVGSSGAGATWLAAENVGVTGVSLNSNIRLRFSIANTGGPSTPSNFRLQIAPKGGSTNCTDVVSGNFTDVTTTIGSNLAVMTTSPNFTNQEATTNQLTDSSTTFVAGKMVEYNSNQSDSITLSTNEFTEVEYNFQMTNNVDSLTPYCFRVVNVDTTLNTYTNVAQLTTAAASQSPNLPVLVSPTDSATGQSLTPTFKTVTTDVNGDNVQYELKICTDSDMSANCQTFDQTSSNVGWSGQNIGTSAYSSGTTATYVLQVDNSLTQNTTYYWKTRAKDYAGTGTWSSTQTTPYSFTTISPNLTQASFRWRLDNGGEDIGSSTFSAGTTYPTIGTTPYSVTSADVNGDGKLDLVTANINGADGNITVFNNNGNGTFATGTTYPTPYFPYSVTSADVNGDGKPDLVTANYGGHNITVFNNNGNGTFATGTNYSTISINPQSVTSADVNGDGKPDLVTANVGNSGTITVFINNGNGTFATGTTYPTLGAAPNSVTSADVNGDGKPDLVTANETSANITVFNNNGNGTFATGTTYPNLGFTPQSVTSADVNGDGKPDLVTANTKGGYGNITVFNNNGNGTFATGTTYPTPYLPNSVTSADVNGDGKPDLISAGLTMNVYINNGNGTFTTGTTYPTISNDPYSVISADVNGDGKPDLVTANQTSNNITVFTNIYSTSPGVSPQNIGITSVSPNSNIRLRFSIANTGGSISSNFRLQVSPKGESSNCTDVASGNFTDVGTTIGSNLAVMTTSPNFTNQQSTSYQLFKETTFATGTTYPTLGINPYSVTSADVNGDGKPDLVSANYAGSNITVFNNNGNGTFGAGTTYPTIGVGPRSVTSADVNGDGHPDLVSANYTGNNITVFNNNGNGTFGTGTTYPTRGSGSRSVTSTDVNGDGKPDLVTANSSSSNITVFNNNGNGTFAAGTTYPTLGTTPYSVTSADVNGDGLPDLVSANYTDNNITVFNNNGNGTFVAGKMVENPSNQSDSITLDTDQFTEVEYNFQMTNNIGSTTPYCFRVVNAGTTLNTYTNIAQLTTVLSAEPTPPTIPTLISPSDSATGQSLTPTFKTLATDANGDNLQYELKICTDSGMTANCQTFDQTANNVGWSGQDVGTSAYYSTTTATYILQVGNSLSENTTYFWKTRAKDYAGSGTWSETQTTAYSFTTLYSNLTQASFIWQNDGLGETIPESITFSTGVTYVDVGSYPTGLISADLNNDGKLDLVTSNYVGQNITVLLGNGSGTYGAKVNYQAESGACYTTPADINNDGYLDLITTICAGGKIYVYTNNGDGTFGVGVTYPTQGTTTQTVVAADINKDGDIDLITANGDSNNITVFSNNGSGVFGVGTTYSSVAANPVNISAADLDIDGDIDLISSNYSSNMITVYNNTGSGTFSVGVTYPTRGAGPSELAIADFNNDGKPDAMTVNVNGDNMTVFTNTGTGTFGTGVTYPTLADAPYSGAAGDINNDGWVDIIADSMYGDKITVYTNDGDGTFSVGVTFPTAGLTGKSDSLNIADINGDGKLDIATVDIGTYDLTIYTNTSTLKTYSFYSTGTTYPTLGASPYSVTSADVNGDGHPDLVSANYTGNNITVFNNNGNGTFGTGTTYPTRGATPASVTSADVNGDGLPDLVTANYTGNNITVFNNNGNGTFGTGTTYPTLGINSYSVTSADVNGDGKSDLVTANLTSNNITVFNNNGNGTFGTGTTYPTLGANPRSVTSADVNGDGKPDLVSANSGGNNITVFNNNGNGTFATGTTYPTLGANPRLVTSTDVNGDGKPDLVTVNNVGNNITVFTNNGNGTFGTGTTYPTLGTGPISVTSADVNGDGHPDLVSANYYNNNITVFNNNGNGTFGTGTTYPTLGTGPRSVTSADFNNDGKPDLVSANQAGNITVFTNIYSSPLDLWLAPENIDITDVSPNSNIRLRFSLANTGSASISSNFRLQVAPKGGSTNCTDVISGNFTDVGTTVGSNLAVMTTSPNFTNQEATTNQLTDSATTFVAGKMVEYDSNQSDSITLGTNEFTEVEYNFQMTDNISSTTPYCFRVVNVDTTLNTYTNVAQLTTVAANQSPTAPTSLLAEGQSSPVTDIIDLTPELSAIYNDPDTDIANKYQIQVDDSSGFGSPIWDSGASGTSMDSCNKGSRCADISYAGSALTRGTVYYWRIKYWGDGGLEGSWSAGTDTFKLNQLPSTPSNVTPGVGATNVALNPILTASAYSDPDADSQSASHWQISTGTGAGFAAGIVFDSGTTTASNTINIGYTLSNSTPYYWRVRYQDDNTDWSNYSTDTGFTTLSANQAPNAPTLISPANSAVGVSLTPSLILVATDPDNNPLQYRITLALNSSFTGTTQTFDQTISNVGWSGQDIGTSAFSSGTTATYIIQTPLNYTTLYYWRAQAGDYSGSNTWGNLSIGYSFTTIVGTTTPPGSASIKLNGVKLNGIKFR